MHKYHKSRTVGQGTFGVVSRARVKETNELVAIKRIRLGNVREGVNFTALREIKLLKELVHPNIIGLRDVFAKKDNSINIVFEFCVTDLEIVIKAQEIVLTTAHVKAYMNMLLEGLKKCHDCWVLHRDLKPSNLLLAANGQLKIGDFGLARTFASPNSCYTHQVVTRWYRAPELLFGARTYGVGVDMWAVGIIFAELMLRQPIFTGSSDLNQLDCIFTVLGTPTKETWPDMELLPDFCDFNHRDPIPLPEVFKGAGRNALGLLSSLLLFDPVKRMNCAEALNHAYFAESPPPTPPERLPMPPAQQSEDTSDDSDDGWSQDSLDEVEVTTPGKRKRDASDVNETPSKRMKEISIS